MKVCPRCKTEKPLDAFHRSSLRRDGVQSICKLCRKQVDADTYLRGGEEYKRRKLMRQRETAIRNGERVFNYLREHPCVDCGESDPIVLEFDHVRGEKKVNISDLIRRYGSWDTIQAEIEKCDVRCANCHRRATAKRQGHQRYLLWQELTLA
jgi:hypothetical protein